MLIEKGTLRDRLVMTTENAVRSGALLPVPTNYTFIEEGGVRYFVRVLESLKRKDEERRKQDHASKHGKETNPFLPPEPDLTVGRITDTHIAVLNKFNVLTHHLLIVTRRFEDQDTPLTEHDFEALWLCMLEYDSLGFYNGGREAGASQQHKHLQVVPLPLAPEGPAVPVQPLLAQTPPGDSLSVVPGFPFLHSFARLGNRIVSSAAEAAPGIRNLYQAMLRKVGISEARPSGRVMPYCLLLTREWMLLVPRSREFFEGISLNSLAFAGSFFVRDTGQLEQLKTQGVMNALKTVARERRSPASI